jgi:hypothetical protein
MVDGQHNKSVSGSSILPEWGLKELQLILTTLIVTQVSGPVNQGADNGLLV